MTAGAVSPSTSTRTALLVGATGLIGGHLLRLLSEDPFYSRVMVLARRPLTDVASARIDTRVIDFGQLDSLPADVRADHVFCALGTTIKQAGSPAAFRTVDLEYPIAVAKLALSRGAEHFLVVSSLGAHAKSRVLYSRVKGEMEQELQALPFRSITIFRPSLLLGQRMEFRLGEEVAKRFGFLMPLTYKPIDASRVASAMIVAARGNRPGIRVIESAEMQKMGAAA